MKVRFEGIEIECNVDEFEEIKKRNLLDVNIKKRPVESLEIRNSVASVFQKYAIEYTEKMTSEEFIEFKTIAIKSSIIRIIFIQPCEVNIFRYFACLEPYSCDDIIVDNEEKLKLLKDKLEDYIKEIRKE